MVVPIPKFSDDGENCKSPTAPELSPAHNLASSTLEEGIHFKLGPNEELVYVSGIILTVGFLADYIRRRIGGLENKTFTLTQVGKNDFLVLKKHLEGEKIIFESVSQALGALKAGYYTDCPTLCNLCVNFIDLNLNQANLLLVLKTISVLHNNSVFNVKWMSNYFLDPGVEYRIQIKNLLDALITNCTNFSTNCAESIIQSDEFLNLDIEAAKCVLLKLDLRNLKNEMAVFNVLKNWSDKYLALENNAKKREIIGEECIFMVRYGLMTENEFRNGPAACGLLKQHEIDKILKYIRNPKSIKFDKYPMNNITHRRVISKKEPFELSERTLDGHLLPINLDTNFDVNENKCSKFNKDNLKKTVDKQPPKILLALLRCWQIVFD